MRLLFLSMIFITSISGYGQKLGIGLAANINTTFFHKSVSQYENKFSTSEQLIRYGLSIPAYLRLNRYWSLKTGIGAQVKQYRFIQSGFEIPGLSGYTYFETRFLSVEVPLIMCRQNRGTEKLKLEYAAGCVLSLNAPKQNSIGYSLEGSDPLAFAMLSPAPEWEKTISPDLYIGISLVRYKNHLRRHQLTVSYQYSLVPTTRFEYSMLFTNPTTQLEYKAILRPTLSCLALSYAYFPKWLVFGKPGMAVP